METPYLKFIVGLIRISTNYDTNQKIALELGITEATLRGYWNLDKVMVPSVPDRNLKAFQEFFGRIISFEVTEELTRQLLQGTPINFHNALCPISGKSWRRFISDSRALQPLQVTVVPLPKSLKFGDIDQPPPFKPDAVVKMFQQFSLSAAMKWNGECVLIAEYKGEWHLFDLFGDGNRVYDVSPPTIHLPPLKDGELEYLSEKTFSGVYRYYIIACRNKLSSVLREKLHCANPPSQDVLDFLGAQFLAIKAGECQVFGASILVER
ncbi:hypothetical protein [Sessilibacter sp. MAH2]